MRWPCGTKCLCLNTGAVTRNIRARLPAAAPTPLFAGPRSSLDSAMHGLHGILRQEILGYLEMIERHFGNGVSGTYPPNVYSIASNGDLLSGNLKVPDTLLPTDEAAAVS